MPVSAPPSVSVFLSPATACPDQRAGAPGEALEPPAPDTPVVESVAVAAADPLEDGAPPEDQPIAIPPTMTALAKARFRLLTRRALLLPQQHRTAALTRRCRARPQAHCIRRSAV